MKFNDIKESITKASDQVNDDDFGCAFIIVIILAMIGGATYAIGFVVIKVIVGIILAAAGVLALICIIAILLRFIKNL